MNEASHSPLAALSGAIANIVRGAHPSIVTVRSRGARASGFIWRPGLVVTADEALADEGPIEVTLANGERVAGTLEGRDATTDIALLRVDAPAALPVPLVSHPVDTGSLAIVVGGAGGNAIPALALVTHAGAAWKSLRGGAIDARIEIEAALRDSAQGALVLDAEGRAIGMAVFGPRRRVLVIPAATIDRVAATLDAHGKIARGYLGVGLQSVRIGSDAVGAMVMSVDADGPGAAAGIRQGDVIERFDERALEGLAMLVRELGPDSVGKCVRVAARRAGEPIAFEVTIGTRPDA
ncbi:MAG TPA: S1C family serine protease [Casimicrobiaceae bacterium]|nr:S1C family serine protease [Casimicrobiaceae bacterium]